MIDGPSPRWALLAALLCWAFSSDLRAAQSAGFREPAAGAWLEPGQTIEVGLTLERAFSMEIDEMELVLSLDGGKTYPLRVTREISPGTRRISWRVPALPTEHARLALRAGSNETPQFETVSLVSSEFVIVPQAAGSWEALFRVQSEWRTREALESGAAFTEAGFAESQGQEIDSLSSQTWAAEPPKPTVARVSSDARQSWSPASRPARAIDSSLSFASPPDITLRQ